ncbi:oligosaccharide flippase family protein [Photobacterium aphoticum]|uniref:Polysaccharide biosynthesis protein n=1 Tax=Photobacterium aphoticum TaxID=754436 RepID=A0A0J1GGM7_9GAMM|nr:oligosaccharide flippase family protein [Photobacterium aphoticum]KLU98864.1 hypothetical protein ABT58_20175 [Photobacterium aphoticum]GHA38835.1 hypothetical protein GCM10007086_10460 [Photobacterium aphoticum]
MFILLKKILAADFLSKILQVILTLLIIRIFSKDNYANYSVILAWASIIIGLTSGFNVSLLRITASGKNKDNENIYLLLFTSLFLVAVIIGSLVINHFYGINASLLVILTSSLGGIQLLAAYYQAQEKIKKYALINSLRSLIPLLTVFFLMVASLSVSYEDVIYLFLAAYISSISIYIANEKKPFNLNLINLKNIRSIFRENLLLLAYYSIIAVYTQYDLIFLSQEFSNDDISNFAVLQRLYLLTIILLPSVVSTLRIYTAKDTTSENLRALIVTVLKKSIFLGFFICLLIVFLYPMSIFIVGEQYSDAVEFLPLFAFATFFSYVGCIFTPIFISKELYKQLIISGIASVSFKLLIYDVFASDLNSFIWCFIFSVVFYNIFGLSLMYTSQQSK